MRTIADLEKAAGITDRAAFWMPFAKITGTFEKDGKLHSNGFEAGVTALRKIAATLAGEEEPQDTAR